MLKRAGVLCAECGGSVAGNFLMTGGEQKSKGQKRFEDAVPRHQSEVVKGSRPTFTIRAKDCVDQGRQESDAMRGNLDKSEQGLSGFETSYRAQKWSSSAEVRRWKVIMTFGLTTTKAACRLERAAEFSHSRWWFPPVVTAGRPVT